MKKLEREQVRVVATLAALLAGGGLVLMFCSPVFGTYLGDAWLSSQMDGMADTSTYCLWHTRNVGNGS
ncbi:hypothetical protein NCCP2716_28560 [Sporosarcina sp. NCCP-2716]|uniref:hypothetical protein n=1 Tax=Sporosarcina sp. NCCP-2716 TaxID=2943679 RepID=UPI00203FF797|nr:hypothetical protein [Sporosarcina sp. NCCP-2716]GKV70358.1 hypothetical protein NCCP2716_28560 [Sporosarcina sp. NCCP-2716]